MTQEQEFQEVIKKNLPAQVGDVLKARLEQADRDANTIKTQDERIKELNQQVMKANELIENYKQFDKRNEALDGREKGLKEKEIIFEIEVLKYQLLAEKDKTEFSKNIALGLVRNTEYRKTIFDSETSGQPITDGQGYTHYPVPTTKLYDESQKVE